MTSAEIQAELQAAIDQENADETTHAAAIQKAISDLSALPAGAPDRLVTLVGTTESGQTVNFTVS